MPDSRKAVSAELTASANQPASNGITSAHSKRKPSGGQATTPDGDASLANLLDQIETALKRYIIFPNEHAARVLALKVIESYCREDDNSYVFDAVLYIYLRSRSKGCGKSRLLDILHALLCLPTEVHVRPTEATLFREINTHSIVMIDEIQRTLNGPEADGLISILTSGNRRSGNTMRADNGNQMATITYSTFGTKIYAGRDDTNAIPDDVISRSYVIDMPREPNAHAKLGNGSERWKGARFAREHGEPIKQACAQWASANRTALRGAEYLGLSPDAVPDREFEAWESLLVIAAMAGTIWEGYATTAILDAVSTDDDADADEHASGGMSFDDAILHAMERQFIRVSDYDDARNPPAILSRMPSGLTREAFGWGGKRMASYVSLRVDEDNREYTLRIPKDRFAYVVQKIERATGQRMPAAADVLRELRSCNRLTTNSPRAFSVKSKVWASSKVQTPIICIDVSRWFVADGSNVPDYVRGKAAALAQPDSRLADWHALNPDTEREIER